jgi:hypothetical protein
MPFYEDLGTPDKELKLYDTGHATPADKTAEYADQWLRQKLRSGNSQPATVVSPRAAQVGH